MATSRSDDPWVARALLYSGRPDPEWTPRADVAVSLERLWRQLAPAPEAARSPPPLGYRGCILERTGGPRFWAFGGSVTRDGGQTRRDAEREFERRLLRSAPAGLVPPGLPGVPGHA